jgi:hypothetical protein
MKYFSTPLLAVLIFFACKDNNNPAMADNFTLTFKASYEGQPLEKYKNYPYGNSVVQFDRFNIFLSDITLLKGAEEIKLSEIEWVDFTPDLAPDNKAVDVQFTYHVPEGDYTGIKIGYGVKPALNAKKPSDFAPEHPLYIETEYWSGWKSYIFAKVQGEVDLDGNDTTETNIFYHCGSDAMYDTGTVDRDIRVRADGSATVTFDLHKLFTTDGQLLDLTVPDNRTTSHSASNIVLGQKIMFNFKNAVSVQ